jgi:hypothetical protein
LLASTVLTLFVVPILYTILNRDTTRSEATNQTAPTSDERTDAE